MAEKCNSEKRYYWLKLSKEGFFESRPIKRLRRMPSGDRLCMLYLLLLLKSCSNNGSIFLEDIKEEPEEQIALDIDADTEEVETLLKYLSEYKLLEIHDNELVLTQFQSLVGSKTDAAERMKRSRDRKKEQQSNDSKDVTMLHEYHNSYNSRNNVAIEETEKKLKKDSEIDQQTDRQTEIKAIPANEDTSVDSDGRTAWNEIVSFLLDCGLGIPDEKITSKRDVAITGITKLNDEGYSLEDIKSGLLRSFENYKQSDKFSKNGWQYMNSLHILLTDKIDVLKPTIKRIHEERKRQVEYDDMADETMDEMIYFHHHIVRAFDSLEGYKPTKQLLVDDSIKKRVFVALHKLLESGYNRENITKAIVYYYKKYKAGADSFYDLVIFGTLKRILENGDYLSEYEKIKSVPDPVYSEPVKHNDTQELEELPFN